MMRLAAILLGITIGILGGFYGGYRVGQGNASASTTNSTRQTGAGQGAGQGAFSCARPSATPSGTGAGARGRGVAGTVTTLESGSLTIHDARCNTDVKVTFPAGVVVRKTISGTAADLQENQTITVQGRTAADGSVTATSITIVPAGSGFPGGGRRQGTPSPGGAAGGGD